MDPIDLLPKEIWEHVIAQTPVTQLRGMMLAHRMFYAIAYPRIWENLSLCSMDIALHEKIQEIQRKPHLGKSVKHVLIQQFPTEKRIQYAEDRCRETYTRSNAYYTFNWDRTSLRRLFLSPSKTIEHAAKILPFLPSIQSLTLNFLPLPFIAHEKIYFRMWGNLPARQLRKLEMKIKVRQLDFLAACVNSDAKRSPGVLDGVEEVRLSMTGEMLSAEALTLHLRDVVGPTRSALKRLFVSSTNRIDTLALLAGLGHFPHLERFQLNVSRWSLQSLGDRSAVKTFLKEHRTSLRTLSLQWMPLETVDELWFNPEDYSNECPNLEMIGLHCELGRSAGDGVASTTRAGSSGQHEPRRPMPSFANFANSLTVLSLDFGSESLRFDELQTLIKELYRKVPGGALLRELRTSVEALSPEVLVLFSSYLENLEVLELSYSRLIPQNGAIQEDRVQFSENLRSQPPSLWSLRTLDLYLNRRNEITRDWERIQDMELMNFVRYCIPSVYEFGPLNWAHLKEDIPLYVTLLTE